MSKSMYYGSKCSKCGWVGSSEESKGGEQIADTGDYGDILCPNCVAVTGEYLQSLEDANESDLCDEIVRLRKLTRAPDAAGATGGGRADAMNHIKDILKSWPKACEIYLSPLQGRNGIAAYQAELMLNGGKTESFQADDLEAAIALAHARLFGASAIPVASSQPSTTGLVWTREKPTESGWYLCFQGDHFTTSEMIYMDETVTRWYSKAKRQFEPLPEDLRWYGPLPQPQPQPPESRDTMGGVGPWVE